MSFIDTITGWFQPRRHGDGRGGASPPSNELMELEWREAEMVWRVRKQAQPPVDPARVQAIDALFYKDGTLQAASWERINEAERQLALELTEGQLVTQYSLLLTIATRRRLDSLPTYPDRPAFLALAVDDKRNTYSALLYELQAGFMETRLLRRMRRDIADTLWRYGMGVGAIAILVPFLWLLASWRSAGSGKPMIDETIFVLAAVAASGALGAFFSRAMRFQSDIATLNYDTVIQTYVARMLRLRLLYGVIGAIVFYFFIRGAFVGGGLFPVLTAGMVTEQTTWQLYLVDHAKAKDAATVLAPTAQFAKLLVWSFLAGFSERLVPDTLSQLEKKSNEAMADGK